MTDTEKARQLKRFKMLATGLFVAMAIIYFLMAWLQTKNLQPWMGYVKAFSEAAMVGALADWFAVTALFNYPLGLKIPHTNLIENSKQRIGNNLGNFVSTNFLNAATIKPYIRKLSVSEIAANWLEKDRNKKALIEEIRFLARDILNRVDDTELIEFINRKGKELISQVRLNGVVSKGIHFMVERNEHERIISKMAEKIMDYVNNNTDFIRNKVAEESYFFVPKFLEDKLSNKIISGLNKYFTDINEQPDHPIKKEIESQLLALAEEMENKAEWREKLQDISLNLLGDEVVQKVAADIWAFMRLNLQEELDNDNGTLVNYIKKNIEHFAQRLKAEESLRNKIDKWIQLNAFKYVARNGQQVSNLISNTVGNWQGRELSDKLELEVGKDLQFIRINGTLVGGIVGLLIYTITHFFIK